jgi:hypothetical protein
MDLGVGAGWSSMVARRAHNPKVVGSNPAPATNYFMLELSGRNDEIIPFDSFMSGKVFAWQCRGPLLGFFCICLSVRRYVGSSNRKRLCCRLLAVFIRDGLYAHFLFLKCVKCYLCFA